MPDNFPPIDPAAAPSPTALRVAVLRALHQTVDAPPIFVDPLAARILGPDGAALLDAHRASVADSARLRGTLAARTVVAESTLAAAFARGIRQGVILGAGLDTFAYRHGHASLRVFEVDQPAAQAWKRAMLRAAEIGEPDNVIFVTADLAGDDLFAALVAGGLDLTHPAVFAMLGVVPYVARDAILETLRSIGKRCARGSEIVFDYTEPFDSAPPPVRAAYAMVAERVAAGGEPWITFFAPDDLHSALRDRGFSALEDFDAAMLDARFIAGRGDALGIAPLVHVIRATV